MNKFDELEMIEKYKLLEQKIELLQNENQELKQQKRSQGTPPVDRDDFKKSGKFTFQVFERMLKDLRSFKKSILIGTGK